MGRFLADRGVGATGAPGDAVRERDWITSAELVPCTARALRLDPDVRDAIPHQMIMLEKVRQRADQFDILHFHTDYLHFPLFRSERSRTLALSCVLNMSPTIDMPDGDKEGAPTPVAIRTP
jgi:hypothetical protein